jgi:YbgC/YbaW family acyl-CoA thioester hydrolase
MSSASTQTLDRASFRYCHRLRVRWVEVDMQKIVFNGHYLMYFDTAVAGYWRDMGMVYHDVMHQLGGDMFVKKASLVYHASAQYDDMLDVCLRCDRVGNSSMVFVGGIFHENKLLISSELVYVYANPATQTSMPVPDVLRQWLNAFEAGESMMPCAIEPWSTAGPSVAALRKTVFHAEQGVPEHLLCDEADASAIHAVVRNRMGMVLAAGRLIEKQGAWHIGRMAVLRGLRGGGLGLALMLGLETQAKEEGVREIALSAMKSAQGFYKGLGYAEQGAAYELVGLPHINMSKAL